LLAARRRGAQNEARPRDTKGTVRMPTYVTFFNLTQKGIETVKRAPERIDAARRAFEAQGAKIKAFYLLLGRHDAVLISEAPDDETAARLALTLGMMGYVRSETMRAFTEDEYRDIIAGMP
jgi:uncharacterized protein with GYD domain